LALVLVGVGLITTPMLWVRGMADAYNSARDSNRRMPGEEALVEEPVREVEVASRFSGFRVPSLGI